MARTIRKEKRDKIVAQAIQEMTFAHTYKQGKVRNWQKNEDMYNGKKHKAEDSRANVDLARMQEYVHTLLSKIDNPLIFKFTKRKPSQKVRVDRLNALRVYDANRDDWDIKDIVGKKQAILYGRAIYSYYADSVDSYKPHLDNVDVYDFLIDPSAGGIDMDKARYMGRYGVIKSKEELKQGVKDGKYIREETERLIENGGNATTQIQEDTNKQYRTYGTNVYTQQKEITDPDKYKFWEWYTTYEGEKYYLLLSPTGATAIRVVRLTELFESDMFPFWSWSPYADLTEFWSIAPADYVREIFMAQSVSINQMLDNAEQINKPQKIVDVTMVEDLAELKYRRDGLIKTKGDTARSVTFVETPSIKTPIEVFNVLETIQEKSSGVTAGAKGLADGDEKATIYEGNQANVADRFGLINKAYTHAYKRFARLYEHGVREHLSKKIAVDILGPDGVTIDNISRRDIFWKNDSFNVIIEASNADLALSEAEKRMKLQFLAGQSANPVQNPKKAYEMQAKILGFTEEEVRQLMDNVEFGDIEIISEAERDIEMILDGKSVVPNRNANISYKQKFVDYMADHAEDISDVQFADLSAYVAKLNPVIARNMARNMADLALKSGLDLTNQTPTGAGGINPLPLAPQQTEDINLTNTNGGI